MLMFHRKIASYCASLKQNSANFKLYTENLLTTANNVYLHKSNSVSFANFTLAFQVSMGFSLN